MKKILCAFALIFCLGNIASAQVKTTVTTKTKSPGTVNVKTVTATKMKADGTPDMRYKKNKGKIKGPKKADGTADMRYKANKSN